MEHTISPAAYVIQTFGGVRATARAIGRDPSSIAKWRMPRGERKGLGGRVPGVLQTRILEEAEKRGLDIRPEDLILGRTA